MQLNRTLTRFVINHCPIRKEGFEGLAMAIANHRAIEHLDLSYDGLDDSYGEGLRRVIAAHTERRCEILWIHGLRNSQPEDNAYRCGLFELVLTDNRISDAFVEQIVRALSYDDFISVLDLRRNDIHQKGIDILLHMLRDNNEALLNLDLRDNPGLLPSHRKLLAYRLLKNIQKGRQDEQYFRIIVERKWINKDLLFLPRSLRTSSDPKA